ncbi:hypothetical protein [Aquimarina spinulae]|uniref:hypothetical protein n=1 Tax=Aquimarina spinulae TaxID=1192023 RepID=UPI000D54D0EB|nr:hypothetical protein [Aquimarina spinulae]
MNKYVFFIIISFSFSKTYGQVCRANIFDFKIESTDSLLTRESVKLFSIPDLTFCRCPIKFNYVEEYNTNTDTSFSVVNCHIINNDMVFPLKIVHKESVMILLIKLPDNGLDKDKNKSYSSPSKYILGNIYFKPGFYLTTFDNQGKRAKITECNLEFFYEILNKDYEYKDIKIEDNDKNWTIVNKKFTGGSMFED